MYKINKKQIEEKDSNQPGENQKIKPWSAPSFRQSRPCPLSPWCPRRPASGSPSAVSYAAAVSVTASAAPSASPSPSAHALTSATVFAKDALIMRDDMKDGVKKYFGKSCLDATLPLTSTSIVKGAPTYACASWLCGHGGKMGKKPCENGGEIKG